MRAVVIEDKNSGGKLVTIDEASLLTGDVELDVLYSSYNYKDGMALNGRGIIRTWPLVPGIDIVGRVTASRDPHWVEGDLVILNGDDIGESLHGGFATRAHVRADALVRLPETISPARAASIGTAGFTAMIAVLKIRDAAITPDAGDILVTGAAGGVGSIAVSLLAGRGYRVVASTGRVNEQGDYLKALGAAELLDRAELSSEPRKPVQRPRWAAAIDVAGSATLGNIIAQTNYGGLVVSCGLAQGLDLPVTVLPFILNDVTLTGANSVKAPLELRQRAWEALGAELDLQALDQMTTTIGLSEVIDYAPKILAGQVRGRTVVDPQS